MKTNRLIYGIIFICFLAFSAGPMFFGVAKTAFAAEEVAKPEAKPEMKAPVEPEKKPEVKAYHKKTAHKAMKSEKIMEVQKALNGAGFTLKEDGMMGKATHQALKKYQKDNNLKVTGKADKETLEKLGVE
jgi:peptidoglycan hydrolase-like protein with peptidoglycan-binding domain